MASARGQNSKAGHTDRQRERNRLGFPAPRCGTVSPRARRRHSLIEPRSPTVRPQDNSWEQGRLSAIRYFGFGVDGLRPALMGGGAIGVSAFGRDRSGSDGVASVASETFMAVRTISSF